MLPARGEASSDYRPSVDVLQLQPPGKSCIEQLIVPNTIACEFNARTWAWASRIGVVHRVAWLCISPALLAARAAQWYRHVNGLADGGRCECR